MGSRIPSHQLSNGLVVSGRPEQQLKERQPTMASRAVPYTGGDVKKSGSSAKCSISQSPIILLISHPTVLLLPSSPAHALPPLPNTTADPFDRDPTPARFPRNPPGP
ncbi:Ubiquitin-specific protease family C19-related protein [Prunus dulcis]|uniref:Ubiquitin-specific protease family C19-related protein n=1 Tax=Prunus dulcis TaxID=3755 RepID=A0A4Y1R8Z6_PRUDU|nr:Ubiquitin-specific protease family C19-related protein [Prunus dulcis]